MEVHIDYETGASTTGIGTGGFMYEFMYGKDLGGSWATIRRGELYRG